MSCGRTSSRVGVNNVNPNMSRCGEEVSQDNARVALTLLRGLPFNPEIGHQNGQVGPNVGPPIGSDFWQLPVVESLIDPCPRPSAEHESSFLRTSFWMSTRHGE